MLEEERDNRLAIDDKDVLAAVHGLSALRSGSSYSDFSTARTQSSSQPTPSLSIASSSTVSLVSDLPSFGAESADSEPDANFVSRVSNIPLVNSALWAYEQGKASSRMVKYGAEMVESSVKTISKPVIDRLPVNQLDEFACRQLDRIGRYSKQGQPTAPDDNMQVDEGEPSPRSRSPRSRLSIDRERVQAWEDGVSPGARDINGKRDVDAEGSPDPDASASSSVRRKDSMPLESDSQEQVVATRSKWQALFLEAGGIGAAVSEESMKKLKYCLHWLQYATSHIDQQILLLRSFIASISPSSSSSSSSQQSADALVPIQTLQTLTEVKKDLVSTIRQVVDVVSKYAGSALPEPAKASVRTFILKLPERWASAARADAPSSQEEYRPYANGGVPGQEQRPTAGAATLAARRVLTLATESLDMMRSVTAVFKESLDRAEAWVERLQVLGLQRQQQNAGALPSVPYPQMDPQSKESLERAYSPASPLTNSLNTLSITQASSATPSPALKPRTLSNGDDNPPSSSRRMDVDS